MNSYEVVWLGAAVVNILSQFSGSDLICKEQAGFLPGQSTVTQLDLLSD